MKRLFQLGSLLTFLVAAVSFLATTFPAVGHALPPEAAAFLVQDAGHQLAVCLPIAAISVDDCASNAGGLVDLFVIRRRDIQTWPDLAADGVTYDDPIVPKTGKGFVPWDFATDTGDVNHKSGGDTGNQSVSMDLNVYIPKGQPDVDKVVNAAINGDYVVIGRDSNGFMRVMGDELRGVKFEHDYKSGKKGTDKNGYDMKFSGEGFRHVPYFYSAAVPLLGGS